MTGHTNRLSRTLWMGAFFALALSVAAYAADASKEISTAADHAGFAAKATTIEQVHAHLHHALNCLVGPKGEGFDASQENPCASMGNGAIPDDNNATVEYSLRRAAKTAQAGLASNDLATAQKAATDVVSTLKAAVPAGGMRSTAGRGRATSGRSGRR